MAYPLKMMLASKMKPYERNARRHPPEQIEGIKTLFRMAGFVIPILYDCEADHIIAGHGRWMAASQMIEAGEAIPAPGRRGDLPKGKLPIVDGSGMSEAERRAFILADNKITERASWDEQMLEVELGDLRDLGFDLSLTAFEQDELKPFLEVPDIQPASLESQGNLNEKAKTKCPNCGHEF